MDGLTCLVIDMARGTTHDGPGLRTTVFFKGCPLTGLWCQNPEGIRAGQDVWWEQRTCIRCFACRDACNQNAITGEAGPPRIDRSKCTLCGACVEACPALAMAFTGQEWTLQPNEAILANLDGIAALIRQVNRRAGTGR